MSKNTNITYKNEIAQNIVRDNKGNIVSAKTKFIRRVVEMCETPKCGQPSYETFIDHDGTRSKRCRDCFTLFSQNKIRKSKFDTMDARR